MKVFEEQKKIEMEKLSHMKDLEVDLTSYLVSQNKIPDKHYRFDTSNFNKEGNQISQVSADIHPPIQVHLSEWNDDSKLGIPPVKKIILSK